MLLKLLYDLAHSRPEVLADVAFAKKKVRWIISLDSEGNLLGEGPRATGDENEGMEFSCPATTRNKNVGGVSEFLADGISALFGLDPKPDVELNERTKAARDENNGAKYEDFWRQVQEAAKGLPQFEALLKWKKPVRTTPDFLRWGTPDNSKPDQKPAWRLRTASGTDVKLGADNFTFELGGKLLIEDERVREFWRLQHAAEEDRAAEGSERGLCLVTGRDGQTLAATHDPSITGVRNAQQSGAKLVSFERSAPAFSSYGREQSLNAPTSREAAMAYILALKWLLRSEDHRLYLGPVTLCFWTREHEEVCSFLAGLLTRPDPAAVRRFILQPWSGIPHPLAQSDDFYAVALGGNGGRIVVKHWIQVPLESALANLRNWFRDLDLAVPNGSRSNGTESHPFALPSLAVTTVREEKDLRPEISGQLFRAALEGTSPSASLINPLLDQFHSKLVGKIGKKHYNVLFDTSRFALLKLILNRNRHKGTMEIQSTLTTNTDDRPYNCGRLLAVLAATQAKAHEYKLEGPGVIERYFGTASVSPSSVFPLLLRLNRHHLAKISKSDKYHGHERFLEEQIRDIVALFQPASSGAAPDFPRLLDLQAQGRFALGFYQQQARDEAAKEASRSKASSIPMKE